MTNAVARPHVPAWYQGYMRGWLHCGMFAAGVATLTVGLVWMAR